MSDKQFDPKSHLTNLKGSEYLEVKWRLVWLRNEHPDAVIETEMIQHSDTHAIFKATVSIPGPAGSATGWGSETKGDFKDFIEKAETKAIGRALGALGYGTQFAPDLDDGLSKNRPVDSPVQRDAPPRTRGTSQNTVPDAPPPPVTNNAATRAQDVELMSRGQLNVIEKHQKDLGWSIDDMRLIVAAHGFSTIKEFNTEQAMNLIKTMSDPAKADPYIANLRNPKPATQAQMIDTTDASARARN